MDAFSPSPAPACLSQPNEPVETIADLFDRLGGASAVADRLSVSLHTASSWRRRRSIPTGHWLAIIAAAAAKGFQIDADELLAIHSRSIAESASDGLESFSAKPENPSAIPEIPNNSISKARVNGSTSDDEHDVPGRGLGVGGAQGAGGHAGALARQGGATLGPVAAHGESPVLRGDGGPAGLGGQSLGTGAGAGRAHGEGGAA